MASFKRICTYIHSYIASYNVHLNMLKHSPSEPTFHRYNRCYLYSLAIIVYTLVYGILGFGFVWESDPDWTPFDIASAIASRYQFTHQILPPIMWKQIDIALFVTIANATVTNLLLYTKAPIPEQCIIHRDKTNKEVYQLMRKYEAILHRVQARILIPFFVSLIPYWYYNIYLNDTFRVGFLTVLFWLFIMPQIYFICFLCECTLPLYLILTSVYVRVRQRIICGQLATLNRRLSRRHKVRADYHRIWSYFLWLNARYQTVCSDITAYSAFWSDFFTILLASIVAIQCRLIYVLIFVRQTDTWQMAIYYPSVMELNIAEAMLIRQCALVVSWNGRFLKQNRRFLLLSFGNKTAHVAQLLKCETFHEPYSLRSYAFRALGNKRITSRTFLLILSYISTLFMYVCKDL